MLQHSLSTYDNSNVACTESTNQHLNSSNKTSSAVIKTPLYISCLY